MKAAVMEEFCEPLVVRDVPDPTAAPDGAVVRVEASGVCRSDWHAWIGDWPKLFELPHVLGHELCGVIESVGGEVTRFAAGDRVIAPFSAGEGSCHWCRSGLAHLCDDPVTVGFRSWGGFAERVGVEHADLNLVALPDEISYVSGAGMGCRFMTAFHGLTERARVRPGEWVVVHGCGGVGLAAVQIASALGASVVGVDIRPEKLEMATALGAVSVVDAGRSRNPVREVRQISGGGAHVSVDALGIAATSRNGIKSLRKRGRHLQIGLTTGTAGDLPIPIDWIVWNEIELIGSYGMPPIAYESMLRLVACGRLDPARLVRRTVALEETGAVLASMGKYDTLGITVIDRF